MTPASLLYLSGVVSYGLIIIKEPGVSVWFAVPLVLLWPVTMPIAALYFATKESQ